MPLDLNRPQTSRCFSQNDRNVGEASPDDLEEALRVIPLAIRYRALSGPDVVVRWGRAIEVSNVARIPGLEGRLTEVGDLLPTPDDKGCWPGEAVLALVSGVFPEWVEKDRRTKKGSSND